MKLSKGTGHSHRVVLPSKIVRAFWSAERAWHGDDVLMHVETRYVPDGAKVDIEVWEHDPGSSDFVLEIRDAGIIENGECIIELTIDWSSEALGRKLELEGDDFEFFFVARIPHFNLEKKSRWLYVDLDEFELSS